MDRDEYRCASVFTSQNVLLCSCQSYFQAQVAKSINGQILVGDYVRCEKSYEQLYVKEIIARKNAISRLQNGKVQGLASNIDVVFIVTSSNQDFNLARLERYYIIARESGARIYFVLTKTDLNHDYHEIIHIIAKRFPNCGIKTSNFYEFDEEAFYKDCWAENETAILLGSSGVGKSTLINMLLKNEVIKTNGIRINDGKGRHTTTVRHVYDLTGNRTIIDTPGLRSVGISPGSNTIQELFPEIFELNRKCKFADCSHISEPECAIKNALEQDELDYDSYLRYLKLIGDERKREIIQNGRSYEKEKMLKQLNKNDFTRRNGKWN
ncbi:MAG: ribosome small subunit-dependent GTPase A [Oscillospiraceae bacterium]